MNTLSRWIRKRRRPAPGSDDPVTDSPPIPGPETAAEATDATPADAPKIKASESMALPVQSHAPMLPTLPSSTSVFFTTPFIASVEAAGVSNASSASNASLTPDPSNASFSASTVPHACSSSSIGTSLGTSTPPLNRRRSQSYSSTLRTALRRRPSTGTRPRSHSALVPATPPGARSLRLTHRSFPPLSSEAPAAYAERVAAAVPPAHVAAVLASGPTRFHRAALRAYFASHYVALSSHGVDVALRRVLMRCALPAETQEIDRFIEAFAACYVGESDGECEGMEEVSPGQSLPGPPSRKLFLPLSELSMREEVVPGSSLKEVAQSSESHVTTSSSSVVDSATDLVSKVSSPAPIPVVTPDPISTPGSLDPFDFYENDKTFSESDHPAGYPSDKAPRSNSSHQKLNIEGTNGHASSATRSRSRLTQRIDTVHLLAFSLIMLNTDHFNPSNRKKMTCVEYQRNTAVPGLSPEILAYYYDQMTIQPLRMVESHGIIGAVEDGAKFDVYGVILRNTLHEYTLDIPHYIPSYNYTPRDIQIMPMTSRVLRLGPVRRRTAHPDDPPVRRPKLRSTVSTPAVATLMKRALLTTDGTLLFFSPEQAVDPEAYWLAVPEARLSLCEAVAYTCSTDEADQFRIFDGTDELLLESSDAEEWMAALNAAATYASLQLDYPVPGLAPGGCGDVLRASIDSAGPALSSSNRESPAHGARAGGRREGDERSAVSTPSKSFLRHAQGTTAPVTLLPGANKQSTAEASGHARRRSMSVSDMGTLKPPVFAPPRRMTRRLSSTFLGTFARPRKESSAPRGGAPSPQIGASSSHIGEARRTARKKRSFVFGSASMGDKPNLPPPLPSAERSASWELGPQWNDVPSVGHGSRDISHGSYPVSHASSLSGSQRELSQLSLTELALVEDTASATRESSLHRGVSLLRKRSSSLHRGASPKRSASFSQTDPPAFHTTASSATVRPSELNTTGHRTGSGTDTLFVVSPATSPSVMDFPHLVYASSDGRTQRPDSAGMGKTTGVRNIGELAARLDAASLSAIPHEMSNAIDAKTTASTPITFNTVAPSTATLPPNLRASSTGSLAAPPHTFGFHPIENSLTSESNASSYFTAHSDTMRNMPVYDNASTGSSTQRKDDDSSGRSAYALTPETLHLSRHSAEHPAARRIHKITHAIDKLAHALERAQEAVAACVAEQDVYSRMTPFLPSTREALERHLRTTVARRYRGERLALLRCETYLEVLHGELAVLSSD